MRYQRRGINEDGQVANFVETEQVVLFKVIQPEKKKKKKKVH